MDAFTVILIFITSGVIVWYFNKKQSSLTDIPEPSGKWPIIGHLLNMDTEKPHLTFSKWAEECGGIYQIQLLAEKVVVLSAPETLREALVSKGKDFAGRPKSYYRLRYLSDDFQDLLSADPGPEWNAMRKLVQREMKLYDYHGDRAKFEIITGDIFDDLMKEFASTNGKPFEPIEYIQNAVFNIMGLLLTGRKYSREDKMFKMLARVENLVRSTLTVGGSGSLLDAFPWLRFFGNNVYRDMQEMKIIRDEVYSHIKSIVLEDFAQGQSKKGIAHALIEAQQQPGNQGNILSELQVKLLILNLYIGGTATTINTLYIFIHLLVNNPDIQRKLLAEVMSVVGKDRRPRLSDRDQMPYTRATLLELLRISSILPTAVPHCALVDSSIGGKKIPKGTQIFMNFWELHHSKSLWDDPDAFRPSRFLDDEGNLLAVDHPVRKHMLPFSSGPRVCLGESLAVNRLFQAITMFVQRIHVDYDYSKPSTPCDPQSFTLGIVLSSLPYTVRMFKRE